MDAATTSGLAGMVLGFIGLVAGIILERKRRRRGGL